MDRQEQVGLGFVGDFGAPLQRNERVVGAGENHFASHPFFDQVAQPLGDIQHQVFLAQPARTNRSGIVSAMARVEDDAP